MQFTMHAPAAGFLLMCMWIRTAWSQDCTIHLQPNGSALYNLSEETKAKCETDWAINDIVVAHQDGFNKSLVIWQTAISLLLKAYFPNVTYRVDCSMGLHKFFCKDPISSGPNEALHDDGKSTWIIIGPVVVSLALVVGLLVIIWRWKKGWLRRCFQKPGEEPGKPSEVAHLTMDEKV